MNKICKICKNKKNITIISIQEYPGRLIVWWSVWVRKYVSELGKENLS